MHRESSLAIELAANSYAPQLDVTSYTVIMINFIMCCTRYQAPYVEKTKNQENRLKKELVAENAEER